MAATRRRTPAAAKTAAGDAPRPDFEVVGDELVCHPYDDLRLSLVIPVPRATPAGVGEAPDREAERASVPNAALARQWALGLDVRLGKALS